MNRKIDKWSVTAAKSLTKAIRKFCHLQGFCSVMLTGGRSAEVLYMTWSELLKSSQLMNVFFYFGDERCVPWDHIDSNYGLAMRTLFSFEKSQGLQIHRLQADNLDLEASSDLYSNLLPEVIDVLLLSMGEDGHIASLFPNSDALWESERKVVPVVGPKPPFQRLTITPPVIQSAKEIYVLAIGEKKRHKYEEALINPEGISSIPARLVLHGNWFFESAESDDQNNLCQKP